ncbi:MAG: M1 family aminopeptidase [Pseudomonadota bacterium]
MKSCSIFAAIAALTLAAACNGDAEESETIADAVDVHALTPTLEELAPVGRLPQTVQPVRYDVEMRIDPREDAFSGQARITIDLAEAADGVWLHGDDLNVEGVTIQVAGQASAPGTYEEILPTGVSWVGFPETLGPGEVIVDIAYSSRFDPLLAGLFKVEEGGAAYALAKSESIQARRFLPGFDEPGFKAPFSFAVTVPEGDHVILNTPEISRAPAAEPGFETVRFAPTRPLSTYLLSLAVGPFDMVERPDLPPNEIRDFAVPLRGFARQGRGHELKDVLDATGPMLEIFERGLEQPYPYQKLDIIAAPSWPSGATELAGAITYRESRILLGQNPPPAVRRAMLAIHAHEIAHMWFGNLVTPPWWDDLWLKEAFASWGTPFALVELEPDAGHEVDSVVRGLSAMRLDSLGSARRVNEPIERNEDIRNAYDAITYSKGQAVIAMVDAYFGAENFRPALGRYIAEFADGAADSADFYRVIGEVSGEPRLEQVFQSFIGQQGLPLVTVSHACTADGVEAAYAQSRYRPLGSEADLDRSWTIPVCLSLGGADDGSTDRHCTLLEAAAQTETLEGAACPAYVMPNADGAGYYRWSLEPAAWSALADRFDTLPQTEALSVVDSAIASFEAGEGDADALLDVIEAAARSPYRRVAAAPLRSLQRYARLIQSDEALAAFQAVAGDIYRARYNAFADAPSVEEIELRSVIAGFLAMTAKDETVRADLANRAAAFIGYERERDAFALSSDEYGEAFTVAVEDLGPDFFEALLAARRTIDDPRFSAATAPALASAADPALAARVRDLAVDGGLDPREAYRLIETQMFNRATQTDAWAWLGDNFPAFIDAIPRQWPRRTPGLASQTCDLAYVEKLDALFAEHGGLAQGHQRALAQAKETITLCGALKAARGAELEAAFLARAG